MLDLVLVGIGIIFVGFLVVLLATFASREPSEEGERRTEVKGGGVILIGPIPIVFGSDAKWAGIAMALAIVLIVIVVLSWVLFGL
jgi:uncharacterized protein (TIGR00304 family)